MKSSQLHFPWNDSEQDESFPRESSSIPRRANLHVLSEQADYWNPTGIHCLF